MPVLFYLSDLFLDHHLFPPAAQYSQYAAGDQQNDIDGVLPLSHWSALRESGALHFGQNFTLGAGRCSLHSIMPILHETAAVDHQLVLKVLGDHIGYGGHRPFLSLGRQAGTGITYGNRQSGPTSCISVERLKVLTFP